MTHDATTGNNYSYDQENRITGAAGYTYTYDADGNRVEKSNGSTGTIYWYMTLGIVAESDLTGALNSEYVFFDGERVARKDFPGNAVSCYFVDHLKTASVITDSAGNIKEDEDFYPWGGELQFVNSDSNHYKFGGHERDNETGLDYMLARYYSNPLGRFLTPDWAGHPTEVPYANFGNPQSLNLYSYTKNNPTTFGDPDGHFVQNDQKKQPPPIPQYEYKPPPKSAFEQKIVNFLDGKGWKTNSQVAAQDAQDRADWAKAHPFEPYPELKIGIVTPTGGVGSGEIEPMTKAEGSLTEPKLPAKTIVQEDGVTVEHYTRSGDHGPPHAHVSGEGPNTRIGQNGKPLKGDAELSPTQRQVVQDNKSVIRKAIDQIGRWFDFNRQ